MNHITKDTFTLSTTNSNKSQEIVMPKSKNTNTCPICNKNIDETYKPFCSKRCADIDLHRWLTDGYKLEDITQS